MALSLDLKKSQQKLVLSLQKAGIVTPPEVDLAFVLDVSGSFEDEHRAGITTDLLSRLVPWGMTFDPDKKLDVFTFSDGPGHAHYVGEVTEANYQGFVKREIIKKVPGWKGGTDYSFVLEMAMEHFGWGPPKRAGFLSRLFGGGGKEAAPASRKSLVVFVTDGENSDKERTEEVLRRAQGAGAGIYFLFLGVSNQGGQFEFLQRIDALFDNTAVVVIPDVRAFVQLPDEKVNETLLGAELLKWLGT